MAANRMPAALKRVPGSVAHERPEPMTNHKWKGRGEAGLCTPLHVLCLRLLRDVQATNWQFSSHTDATRAVKRGPRPVLFDGGLCPR